MSAAATLPAPSEVPLSAAPTLESVYREHYAYVWTSLRRLGVPTSTVDDAVQEVFMVVHRRLPQFEFRASIKTWLFRIAMRVAMAQRRKARRDDSDPMPPLPDPAAGPDDSLAKAQAIAIVDRLMDELDDEQRAVFVLVELQEMTGPEAAEALDVNVNTVYSRLRLAREKMARSIRRFQAKESHVRA